MYSNVPNTAEPYIPILFAYLHEPDYSSHVKSEAAMRIELETGAALTFTRCVLNHRAMEKLLCYKPTLCQKKARFR